MAKLNPPNIEGSIPAFTGTTIVVPFSMNRSVGQKEVGGMRLKVKTVQSNSFLFDIPATINWADMTATGNLIGRDTDREYDYTDKVKPGQFYKLQLAYIDDTEVGTVGYYSTVGVIKCASANMEIGIQGLEFSKINNFNHSFLGYYKHEDDPTEREYSYRFVIYDTNGVVIKDSGTKMHISDNDISSSESYDQWEYLEDLSSTTVSYIQYTVTTVNKIILKTSKYKLLHRNIMPMDVKIELVAELDFDNGYVRVNGKGISNIETPLTGGFLLTRSEKATPNAWVSIQKQNFQAVRPSEINFTDFTIEQGKTYTYALQQFNDNGLYSERIISNSIYADFEDMFLYDGDRQLKIRYNPKVSSFKIDVLESKTETIGSQYPFIFRNGAVYYREFPISGLISYQMDEEHLFMKFNDMRLTGDTRHRTQTESNVASFVQAGHHHSEINAWGDDEVIAHIPSPSLTNYNIAAERWFKMEVLEWLNNGQPKLFRSPTEGNYIVRLMNSSLTPNDTVGRMLHTFQCTAYEIEKYDYNKLTSYGLTQLDDIVETVPTWKTSPVEGKSIEPITFDNDTYNGCKLLAPDEPAFEVLLTDFLPGDKIGIEILPEDSNVIERYTVVIGATGSYRIENVGSIQQVWYLRPEEDSGSYSAGMVTIGYNKPVSNNFDMIEDVEIGEVRIKQIFGPFMSPMIGADAVGQTQYNLLYYLTERLPGLSDMGLNKTELWQFIEMKIEKRDIEPLYYQSSLTTINDITISRQEVMTKCYLDRNLTKPATNLFPGALYQLFYMGQNNQETNQWNGGYIDGDFTRDEYGKIITNNGDSIYNIYHKEDYSAKVYIDYFEEVSGERNYERNAISPDILGQAILKTPQQKLEEWANVDSKDTPGDNRQVIDVAEIDEVVIKEAFPQHNFFGTIGTVVTVAYMPRTIVYNLEESDPTLATKQRWEEKVEEYATAIRTANTSSVVLERLEQEVRDRRNDYLTTLGIELKRWLVENGRA